MHFWHRFKPYVLIPMIIGGIVIALVMAFLLGLVVMLLWNWLMPVIFGLPEITYWQGWGLVLLAHILFKTGTHHHDHDHDRENEHEWKRKFRERISRKYGEEATDEDGTGNASSGDAPSEPNPEEGPP